MQINDVRADMRISHLGWSLLMIGLLCPTWACDRRIQENREWNLAGRRTLEKSTRLAESDRPGLPVLGDGIRVWINKNEVGVDEAGLWAGLDRATLDGLAAQGMTPRQDYPSLELDAHQLPPESLRTANGYLIEPLFDSLAHARDRAKQIAKDDDREFSGEVVLWVAANTPFSTLSRVLYTLGQAEFSRFHFAVSTLEGVRDLVVDVPKYCAGAGCEAKREPRCRELTVSVQASGIVWRHLDRVAGGGQRLLDVIGKQQDAGRLGLVDALDGNGGLGLQGLDGGGATSKQPTKAQVKKRSPDARGCQQHARVDSRLDLASLRTALKALPPEPPACQRDFLVATGAIPWQELVSVSDVMAAAGHAHFTLGIAQGDDGCND